MLELSDEEPPFPCTITMPFVVVAPVTIEEVGVVLVGDSVTVLITPVRLTVLVVEPAVLLALSVPVQLVPAQQQATCPAQS